MDVMMLVGAVLTLTWGLLLLQGVNQTRDAARRIADCVEWLARRAAARDGGGS